MNDYSDYQRRFESLINRIKVLSSLRKTICLPSISDLTNRQWSVIESQLSNIESHLLIRLKNEGRNYLQTINEWNSIIALNKLFGEIEIKLAESFAYFDTFMDILTQRCSPQIGPFLSGCDVLAWNSINKNHPALTIVEPPVVFCNRGVGAAILREGVPIDAQERNPMPTIQIPYSKLVEKYNLTSLFHEMGHEANVRLGLVYPFREATRKALNRVNASKAIVYLYAKGMFELVPDFWAFCNCGVAASASIREILAFPPKEVFRVSWGVHPPPYLRVLISFEWCRQLWGRGWWDEWERRWLKSYSLIDAPREHRKLIESARSHISLVSKILFDTKLSVLNGRTLPSLFNLNILMPWKLQRIAESAKSGVLKLGGLNPCVQLTVFRIMRDIYGYDETVINKIMSRWLLILANKRHYI